MPVLLWSTKGNVPEALWFRAITKKEGDTAFSTFSIPPPLLSPLTQETNTLKLP